MIFLLAGVVPIVFIAALALRPSPPPANAQIPNPPSTPDGFSSSTGEWRSVQDHEDIQYQLLSRPASDARAISLKASKTARFPELLIYWSENQDVVQGQLLGSWAVTTNGVFVIPEAKSVSGQIVLYDIAKNQVIAKITL